MAKRPYQWRWTASIERETLTSLQSAANSLGFVVQAPGTYEGVPSPASYLDSLAAAYERNPAAFRQAMIELGVIWRPDPDAE
jgi:hypothetical protein